MDNNETKKRMSWEEIMNTSRNTEDFFKELEILWLEKKFSTLDKVDLYIKNHNRIALNKEKIEEILKNEDMLLSKYDYSYNVQYVLQIAKDIISYYYHWHLNNIEQSTSWKFNITVIWPSSSDWTNWIVIPKYWINI